MRTWGLPGLESAITIRFNPRLRRAVARCTPDRFEVTLNARLMEWDAPRLAPILCHEAAHLAAFLLYGGQVRPHGQEWAELVRAVGYTPARRCPVLPIERRPHQSSFSGAFRFEHRCAVCHQARWARRRMPHWRCADCVSAGLPGELVIRDAWVKVSAE
jgi:SprT protein